MKQKAIIFYETKNHLKGMRALKCQTDMVFGLTSKRNGYISMTHKAGIDGHIDPFYPKITNKFTSCYLGVVPLAKSCSYLIPASLRMTTLILRFLIERCSKHWWSSRYLCLYEIISQNTFSGKRRGTEATVLMEKLQA